MTFNLFQQIDKEMVELQHLYCITLFTIFSAVNSGFGFVDLIFCLFNKNSTILQSRLTQRR